MMDRVQCEESLHHFVRRAWEVLEPSTDFVDGKLIEVMCRQLERVDRGEVRRLLINIPPGTMKSLLTSVFYPAWQWGPRNKPHLRYIGVAHEMTLAQRDATKMRRLVQSDWYQDRWPHVQLAEDQNEKRRFENTSAGFRVAKASTGITGERGDCLLAGTLVETESGPKAIEEIVDEKYGGKVLSFDQDTGRLVYRRVQAVARRSSPDFYRLHFAGGNVVECTGDHRVYTANRGYVQARFLAKDDVFVRAVRYEGHQDDGRSSKKAGRPKKQKRGQALLQSILRADLHEHHAWQAWPKLQGLRHEDQEGSGVVLWGQMPFCSTFPRSQPNEHNKGWATTTKPMLELRHHDRPTHVGTTSEVLFCEVQRRRPFTANGWAKKSRLEGWGERTAPKKRADARMAHQQEDCFGSGSSQMRIVRGNARLGSSPHQYGEHRSPRGKSSDALQCLPHGVSCSGTFEAVEEHISVVERVCGESDVFDIQVDGTRCFFANGILVHNCVIFDDPHSVAGADSDSDRPTVVRNFREAINTRVNDAKKSAIIVIMQRLHEKDVSGTIISDLPGWEHICFPMRYDAEIASEHDWREEDGELLFPERFDDADVEELEITMMSYAASGQLQQRPTPREGGLFDTTQIEYVEHQPSGIVRMVRAWDFAASVVATGKNPDWSVGIKMGLLRDKRPVILAMNRFRKSPAAVEEELKATARLDTRQVRIRIPTDPGQAGKSQVSQFVRLLAGWTVKSERPTGSKIIRAEPFAAQMGAGNVLMVRAPWNQVLIDELSVFPGGQNDDIVDACADAYDELVNGKWLQKPRKVKGTTY